MRDLRGERAHLCLQDLYLVQEPVVAAEDSLDFVEDAAFRLALACGAHLFFEFFLFAFAQGGLREFVELELEKVLLGGEVLGAFLGFADAGEDIVPCGPGVAVFAEQFAVARIVVEHLRVGARVAEQQLLALPVHLDEVFADFLEVGLVDDTAVDARAPLAVFENLAADDELVVAVNVEVLDNFLDLRFAADVENAFDDGFVFAGADHRGLGLVAADHAERLEQNGLARARLAGDGGKAVAERDFGVVDERETVDG